jgi:hypothetical protein
MRSTYSAASRYSKGVFRPFAISQRRRHLAPQDVRRCDEAVDLKRGFIDHVDRGVGDE